MLSEKITAALNAQINAEIWSAYLYLAMSLDADSKSLKGVANWFYIQWREELDHARILQNYLNDRNSKALLEAIAEVPDSWDTPLDMFIDALEHEQEVTQEIDELVQLAFKEKDYATISRLQWFVDEQVEEEKSVRDIITEFERASFVGSQYEKIVDENLEKRTYHQASALI